MTVEINLSTLFIVLGIVSIWIVPIIYGENKCEGSFRCVPLLSVITIPFIWFVLAMIYIFVN